MTKSQSAGAAVKYLSMGEPEAHEAFCDLRWPEGIRCGWCGNKDVMYINSYRPTFKCGACLRTFSEYTGTAIRGNKLPSRIIMAALASICIDGVTNQSLLARIIGIQQKSAHYLYWKLKRQPGWCAAIYLRDAQP